GFFFFQAEDGIRDFHVTGVQTCAFRSHLPLARRLRLAGRRPRLLGQLSERTVQRISATERPGWRELAAQLGFHFHTIDGAPYWDESAYYRFTLTEIERDLEAPTEELHQLCLDLVDRAVRDEALL